MFSRNTPPSSSHPGQDRTAQTEST